MKTEPFALAALLSFSFIFLPHCGGEDAPIAPVGADGGVEGGGAADEPDLPLVPANKVDLLFVVDNSASMGDKQSLLATSVGKIFKNLVQPAGGHAPILDLHVGVISTSLSFGGDICDDTKPRTNDKAHLLNKTTSGAVVAGAETGFLSFGPGGITDVAILEKAASDIIVGVDQTGCGFEAQLESMYRFLVQPDPPLEIKGDGVAQKVTYEGIDDTVLAQRKAFLRPDSALGIVMITDEDESDPDPRSLHGKGFFFGLKDFPGSLVKRPGGSTAPRGTGICATEPASPSCASCALGCDDDPSCAAPKTDPACLAPPAGSVSGMGYDGFLSSVDDSPNVRWFHPKQRFGVDPRFPITRYVRALTNRKVPDRANEHPNDGPYVHSESCTNPIFAATLPASGAEDLCHLPEGTRSRELVFFALVGGVPNELITPAPDWTKILGVDPDHWNETGIDAHMLPSTTPRIGLEPPSVRGENGSDPINGREWDTNGSDLQYACTFALATPRSCDQATSSCDCAATNTTNPPLCAKDVPSSQIRAKAYPTVNELRVAKGLGDRAIVASICAPDSTSGYGPLLDALGERMGRSLAK